MLTKMAMFCTALGVALAALPTADAAPPMQLAQAAGNGVVDKIEIVKKGEGNNVAGTVVGGVVGGLLGHQIGGGRGKTAATAAGAVGGALAGRELQKRRNKDETFRVTVRMDDGSQRVLTQDNVADLQTGQRVRVEGDHLTPM